MLAPKSEITAMFSSSSELMLRTYRSLVSLLLLVFHLFVARYMQSQIHPVSLRNGSGVCNRPKNCFTCPQKKNSRQISPAYSFNSSLLQLLFVETAYFPAASSRNATWLRERELFCGATLSVSKWRASLTNILPYVFAWIYAWPAVVLLETYEIL